jgi:hypothetical protein
MQRDTLFRIASMTKPVTVAAAMALAEEGRLALTDPSAELILIYLIQNHPDLTVDAAAIAGNTTLAKLQSAQPKFVRRTYQALDRS